MFLIMFSKISPYKSEQLNINQWSKVVHFYFHTGHVVFIPGMLFFPILLICQNRNIIYVINLLMNLTIGTKELMA